MGLNKASGDNAGRVALPATRPGRRALYGRRQAVIVFPLAVAPLVEEIIAVAL